MNESDAELRQAVARAHGLDDEAAPLLIGETVDELDASAAKLARLIAERHEPGSGREPASSELPGPFTNMAAERARRKAELAAIFTGAPAQPRDEQGRYARAGAFHRGARASVPLSPPSHDAWLVDVLRQRRADAGGHF
jgi:hypothetical protein